jgi:hypothetical protein
MGEEKGCSSQKVEYIIRTKIGGGGGVKSNNGKENEKLDYLLMPKWREGGGADKKSI